MGSEHVEVGSDEGGVECGEEGGFTAGNEVVGGAVEAGKGGGGGVGGVDEVPNGGGAYAKECGDDPWEEDASAVGGAVGVFFVFFGGTLGEDGGCIGDGGGNVGG